MSGVFISYAREDETRVQSLAAALEERGIAVFWDRNIPAGQTWRSHIGEALRAARCVVVVWSRHSIESTWVAEEADEGKRKGHLVPVLIDSVEPPIGFRSVQAADLSDWQPGSKSPRFDELCETVERLCLGSGLSVIEATSDNAVTPGLSSSAKARPKQSIRFILGAAAMILAAGGLFFWHWSQEPQSAPLRITVDRLKPPRQITITNRTRMRVKVLAFNAGDTVRLIARSGGDWTLDPGQSARYERGNYWFKVFRPGRVIPSRLDQLLAESRGIIGSDVVVTGNDRSIAILGVPDKPVTFTNHTAEELKLCAYTSNRQSACWNLGRQDARDWNQAPAQFTVKVFRLEAPDEAVAVEPNVPAQASVKIEERG